MTLSETEVRKIADLARLAIEDDQVALYGEELGRIIDLFAALAAVDTEEVEPMAHPLDLVQRLRADEVTESDQRALFQGIAPAVHEGLYVVPKVIE